MKEPKKYFNVAGRLVQGNVFEPQVTDRNGKPLLDDHGKPYVKYFMGLAVAKDSPEFAPLWQELWDIGTRDFPNGQFNRPDFSWKIIDGDSPDNIGKEGFPGHWVFRFTSGFPVQAVADNGTRPIADKDEIKRGYYIRIFFTSVGNNQGKNKNSDNKPGIYLNPTVVLLLGYGPEISSGPDASALAASVQGGYVPPGMQSHPVGNYGQTPGGQTPGGTGQAPAVQPVGNYDQTPGGAAKSPGMQSQPAGNYAQPAPGGVGQSPAAHPGHIIPPNHNILNPQ